MLVEQAAKSGAGGRGVYHRAIAGCWLKLRASLARRPMKALLRPIGRLVVAGAGTRGCSAW